MLHKIDKETIDFICKHKLTFTQLGICILIHEQNGSVIMRVNKEVGMIGDCLIEQDNGKYKTEINDLIDRGFIKQISTSPELSEPFAFDNFKLSDFVTRELMTSLEEAAQELIDNYPSSVLVGGIEYPARSCDFEELEKNYLKAIKSSVNKHRQVIARLIAYRERNTYAQVGITKFVGGRLWETLEDTTKVKSRGY